MKNIIYIIIIVVAVVMIFGGNDKSPSSRTQIQEQSSTSRDNSTMAYVQAKNFVNAVLKSPSSADFPFAGSGTSIGDSTYKVTSYVDSQNGFGAMIRNDYSITLKHTGGEPADQRNWSVKEFIFDGETLIEKKKELPVVEKQVEQTTESEKTEAKLATYEVIEEEDISYAGCKRLAVRVVMDDNTNKSDADFTVKTIAEEYSNWDEVTVWGWGFSERSDVGEGMFTKGMYEAGSCN